MLAVSLLIVPRIVLGMGDSRTNISPLDWREPLGVIFLQYSCIILLIWLISGAFGGDRRQVLSLVAASHGARTHVPVISIVLSVLLTLSFIARFFWSHNVSVDSAETGDATSISQVALKVFIYVALAPIAEELLFRGFLLSALQKSFLGYWGASILVAVLWTALHYQLPGYAIVTTLFAGLAFSVALWITGSLWTCIIAHSAFNAFSMTLYISMLLVRIYSV